MTSGVQILNGNHGGADVHEPLEDDCAAAVIVGHSRLMPILAARFKRPLRRFFSASLPPFPPTILLEARDEFPRYRLAVKRRWMSSGVLC
jgi:hypothetical protein